MDTGISIYQLIRKGQLNSMNMRSGQAANQLKGQLLITHRINMPYYMPVSQQFSQSFSQTVELAEIAAAFCGKSS